MWNLLTGSILSALVRSSRSLAVSTLLLRTEPLKDDKILLSSLFKQNLVWGN